MEVQLIKLEWDDQYAEYKLVNQEGEEISSYDVEFEDEKALISYQTTAKYRHQGYASLGLNLLKTELFKNDRTLLLELIHLSGDYSRKVAENAFFFSPNSSLEYFISLHPSAEDILRQRITQSKDKSISDERVLDQIIRLREIQKIMEERMLSKLNLLRQQREIIDNEEYREQVEIEIMHLEKIFDYSSSNCNRRKI